jgi:3-dehydroquinate synthase
VERVILVGLSGSGKSSVARAVAARLGFNVVDTDDELVSLFGASPAQVFASLGEPVFRAAERQVVSRACTTDRVVVATGGGVVLDEANWTAMRPGAVIVHLRAAPGELLARLRSQIEADTTQRRPLLEADDASAALAKMWEARRDLYARADIDVKTDGRTVAEVAEEVVDAVRARADAGLVPLTSIGTPSGRSDIYVANGVLDHIGQLVAHRWPEARRAWLISDDNVMPILGSSIATKLRGAGLGAESIAVPAGEASKSLAQLGGLLGWMIDGRIDRRDVVLALGGGVIGDLAGFAASVVLRGVGLVQIPTSLLAMVDSSVGGKTGVNHRLGKNLIGSFYQPHLVLADPLALETLPRRELSAGFAEVIKHAMIELSATGASDARLLAMLESGSFDTLDATGLETLVRHNVSIKARVVRIDEREMGPRRLLNYGHTLGHAMEAAGYRYLHGEAIALGLRAAARLAHATGRTTADVVSRQDDLLDRAGLPRAFEGDLDVVMERLTRDKKAVQGVLTWILPTACPGEVEIVRDVPLALVEVVAAGIGATRSAR